MRIISRVGDVDTVASGGFTTMQLPKTDHYMAIILSFFKGVGVPMTALEISADVDRIQMEITKVGSGVIEIVDITATRLFQWLDFYFGAKTGYLQDGQLVIPFTREMLPVFMSDAGTFGIGTADISRIAISIKYKINVGFVTTKVTVKRDIEQGVSLPLGTYPVLKEESREISQTGDKYLRDFPQQQAGAAYLNMHLGNGSGTVTAIKHIKLGSNKIFEDVDSHEHNLLLHMSGKNAQTGFYSFDFQRSRGWLSIDNYDPFEVMINYSVAPAAFDVITDMLYGIQKTK